MIFSCRWGFLRRIDFENQQILHSGIRIIGIPDEILCFLAGIHIERDPHIKTEEPLYLFLLLYILPDDRRQMLQFQFVQYLAESHSIQAAFQLFYGLRLDTDNDLRSSIDIFADFHFKVTISLIHIHDYPVSYRLIQTCQFSFSHLYDIEHGFRLRHIWHTLLQDSSYDAIRISFKHHLIGLTDTFRKPIALSVFATSQHEYKADCKK